MWIRRAATWLCVLLSHAALLFALLQLTRTSARTPSADTLQTFPITLFVEPRVAPAPSASSPITMPELQPSRAVVSLPAPAIPASPAGEVAPGAAPERVDWPIEGKKSVARVLAEEQEAERIARMFAGPSGTWASLTKRQRSKLSKFRWKPGVDGLERDDKGNTIYRMGDGCMLLNFKFIVCALGKPKIHDDMFENMRLYFDEQRLPKTDEGNGTEPEAQPER
jgi:hypothetical protein